VVLSFNIVLFRCPAHRKGSPLRASTPKVELRKWSWLKEYPNPTTIAVSTLDAGDIGDFT